MWADCEDCYHIRHCLTAEPVQGWGCNYANLCDYGDCDVAGRSATTIDYVTMARVLPAVLQPRTYLCIATVQQHYIATASWHQTSVQALLLLHGACAQRALCVVVSVVLCALRLHDMALYWELSARGGALNLFGLRAYVCV